MWSLSRIILWASEKRSNLKQIKAWVKISVLTKDVNNGFDAFLILNNNGEGRIDALGPWKAPIFSLVFNPDFMYLYILSESTLYFAKNRQNDIQKLTGLPLYVSYLFDSLVSNLPENLSECSVSFLEEGDCSRFYMDCMDNNMCFEARIIIHDFPVVEEVAWIGDKTHESFRVKYSNIEKQDGYNLPKLVHFQWSEEHECQISFRSLKLNPPVSKDTFKPDETWFQGKIITLEDLDS